jgi:hypothetical protein
MSDTLPASIVKAICRVQSTLDAVKKSQRNAHGGYNFASTDDIYAELTRRMSEAGLVVLSLEDEAEVLRVEKDGKTSQWLRVVFSFVLATEDATWSDKRARRTLMLQITGPQTFQAAQSYAEKAYLRALFKIPTGDMDLDATAQADTEDAQIALNGGTKRKSSSGAKKDGTDKTFNEIRRDIAGAITAEHLRHVKETWAEEWAAMPARWVEILNDEYDDKHETFTAKEAAE